MNHRAYCSRQRSSYSDTDTHTTDRLLYTSHQGRNHVLEVGGPIPQYRTKYGCYTQFRALCYVTVITVIIKKVGVVRPHFLGGGVRTLLIPPVAAPLRATEVLGRNSRLRPANNGPTRTAIDLTRRDRRPVLSCAARLDRSDDGLCGPTFSTASIRCPTPASLSIIVSVVQIHFPSIADRAPAQQRLELSRSSSSAIT